MTNKKVKYENYININLKKEKLGNISNNNLVVYFNLLLSLYKLMNKDMKNLVNKLINELPKNVNTLFTKLDYNGYYCKSIFNTEKFYDIVIIDGRDRVNCLKNSRHKLTSRGVIILDDSHREKYKEGINYMKNQGFLSIDFAGLPPNGQKLKQTTIFYKRDNCLLL